ncbi:MAG TPA: hypothetical protein VFQ61_21825 [Polyangiaceae bacterium]|nr:hypothetical protein [Polyangiaceae bacterium]
MRKATVEIDKVTGTEFPPRSVRHDGQEYSLASIFRDAGIELSVVEDQADLPPPPPGQDFDLPLLHEYMSKYRKETRDGWYAHILVVPRIEYQEGWSIVKPLGVMYDFRSGDLNNMPREGCAMSMSAVPADPRAYLRTLAHELGHVFNLLHPKAELPPQAIDTSLMNQTADLQALGAFPDNIELSFSASNKLWLSQGPAEFVMPGGRPYTARPDDAGTLVRDEALEVTSGLTLEISTRAGTFELGEPLYLRITLRNDTKQPMLVNSTLSIADGSVEVWITTPSHREFRFKPVVATCHEAQSVMLPPGAEILASEPIFFGAGGHSFPAPGPYQIRARLQATASGRQLAAVSKAYAIEVLPPVSAADVDVADALASPSAALYLILRGGAHLRGAEATLSRIVREAPSRAAAQHAKLAMAAQALTPTTLNPEKAAHLLESVALERLDRTHRAEHQRLLGLARACQGDERRLEAAVQQFETLAQSSRVAAESLVDDTKRWIEGIRRKTQR